MFYINISYLLLILTKNKILNSTNNQINYKKETILL